MRIAVSQMHSLLSQIEENIARHVAFIQIAMNHLSDFIFFPELSLSGYVTSQAREIAILPEDHRLCVFQEISDQHQISISLGIPTRAQEQLFISNVIFQTRKDRLHYSKQFLHEDEFAYFSGGQHSQNIKIANNVIAPAICYESLVWSHAEAAHEDGATIYMASVAKSAKGLEKAYAHYPLIAKEFGMIVLLANAVGPSEGFLSAGCSAVWNEHGILLDQLGPETEGLLIYDTQTQDIAKIAF